MDPLVTNLVDRVKNNDPRLRHVSLRSLPLLEVTNEEIFAVVESLQFNTHVSTFDVSLHRNNNGDDFNEEDDEDVLLQMMRRNRASSLILPPFETILAANSSLVDVRVSSSCCLVLASVFRGLALNKSVQIVQVGEMSALGETTNMTPHCARELKDMLEHNNTIYRLALQGFRWEDEGALRWVCSGLRANHALRVLELLQIVVSSGTAAPVAVAAQTGTGTESTAVSVAETTEAISFTNNFNGNNDGGGDDDDDLVIPFDEETGDSLSLTTNTNNNSNNFIKNDLVIPFDEETGYRSKQMEAAAKAAFLTAQKNYEATNLMGAIGAMTHLKRLCIIDCEMSDVHAFASLEVDTTPSDVDMVDIPFLTASSSSLSSIDGIPSLDEMDEIAQLESCANYNNSDEQQLHHPAQLEELRLVDCELTGLGVLKLQQGCRCTYPYLHILDVRSNSLEDDSCHALAEILSSATSLTKVILEDNNIGDNGLSALCQKGLAKNTTLQQLCLKDNNFGPKGVQVLASVLQTNQSLQGVDLSYNFIGDNGAIALGSMLQTNTTLRDLVLENGMIGGKGVEGLCLGLQSPDHSGSLHKLNLSGNTFGETGINALSALLSMQQQQQQGENGKNRCVLTSLRLASCQLGDVGVSALARALEGNTQLEEIILPFNRFGDEGAAAIGQSLPKWIGLTSLQIQFNLFGEAGFQEIVKGLSQNFYLKSLYLLNAGPSNRRIDKLFEDMQHWIRLNRAGRRALTDKGEFPSNVWPSILARASKAYSADGIFFLLREQPGIVPSLFTRAKE